MKDLSNIQKQFLTLCKECKFLKELINDKFFKRSSKLSFDKYNPKLAGVVIAINNHTFILSNQNKSKLKSLGIKIFRAK